MLALVTLPGIESFLLGECRAAGIRTGAVDDGWVYAEGALEAPPPLGTLRAVVEVVYAGPCEQVPAALPRAERLWFEGQIINGRQRCDAVRAAVAAAAGRPEAVSPDGAPGLVCIVNRRGTALVGPALHWGLQRRRPYRVALMARSLDPAMGRAMAMASRARPGDVFCDPFCGSGTVLAERALLGPCLLVGVDADPAAVDAAGRTLAGFFATGAATGEVRAGDARKLSFLRDREATAVACNPPYGHRFGLAADNRALYPAALREAARVLRPRSRLVVLTADRRHLRAALAACGPALRARSEARVWLGGLEPTLGVYDRTEAPVR